MTNKKIPVTATATITSPYSLLVSDMFAAMPYENSLVGTPVADPERPLEVLRTVHSFDPCMACACHAYDTEGRETAYVRVL